jgi:hypothetical protein
VKWNQQRISVFLHTKGRLCFCCWPLLPDRVFAFAADRFFLTGSQAPSSEFGFCFVVASHEHSTGQILSSCD